MVESTKQVSKNYLSTEKGYADDWAAYIASCHMTAEEALDYIRTTNTQEDRAAHLVDMADFSARSTFVRNGNPWVHCYEEQQKLATTDSSAFLDKMEQLFNAGPGEVPVLGKYRVGESQRTVVSVGTRVMICEEDGSDRPYLLLHLIPVEYLQNTWTFPTEFPLAEISMIVNDGGYVVQSPSLRSRTFLDFIRAYNFPDDYNAVDSLAERLLTTENGLLTYKDSRGVDCYFYYFSFGEGSNIDILGYIPASQIQPEVVEWSIVLLVCGTLFLLFLIDGAYILSINQNLRRAVDMAEHANQAKTQFLSTISHDIRTPLTSIVGNTSAILENGDTLSTEQQRELLRDVNEDAQWLIRMVENLLSITRISGEQTAISKEYEAAEEILAASVHKFEKRFKSNIRIAVEVPQEVVLVPMDATLIQQVLLNLMENAVLHGESTTELRLSVEHIGDEACFTVSDNGLGIPRERLATLFDGSLSGEKGGGFDMKKNMGIGLSVCQTIVKAHGGRITAENRPEGGAQFRFYLPLKEEKEDEDQG
jgi:two-component system sensor histidine kinase KdpD